MVDRTFDSLEEAKKDVRELNAKYAKNLPFCPMINGTCRQDCICFQEAQIYEPARAKDDPVKLITWEPGCNNTMIMGNR